MLDPLGWGPRAVLRAIRRGRTGRPPACCPGSRASRQQQRPLVFVAGWVSSVRGWYGLKGPDREPPSLLHRNPRKPSARDRSVLGSGPHHFSVAQDGRRYHRGPCSTGSGCTRTACVWAVAWVRRFCSRAFKHARLRARGAFPDCAQQPISFSKAGTLGAVSAGLFVSRDQISGRLVSGRIPRRCGARSPNRWALSHDASDGQARTNQDVGRRSGGYQVWSEIETIEVPIAVATRRPTPFTMQAISLS